MRQFAIIDEKNNWYGTTDDRNQSVPNGHRIIPISEAVSLSRTNEIHEELQAEEDPTGHDMRSNAKAAIDNIDTFLAIASPTNAQTLAMVKELSRQNKRIIKRLVREQ